MNNEALKQNHAYVARGYVDGLFCLGCCSNQFSPKLRFCWTAVLGGHSFCVDDESIQKHLKHNWKGAVGVTLRCHPKRQANAFSSSGTNTCA